MKKMAVAAVIALGLASPAFAQVEPEREPDREVVVPIHHTFDPRDIGGTVPGAGSVYTIVPKRPDFANRIQLRTSFSPELQGSVDNL